MADNCEYEYANANCTNCANGLPASAYECARTRGKLNEYLQHKCETEKAYDRGYANGRIEAFKECLEHFEYPHNWQHESTHIKLQMIDYSNGVDWLWEQLKEKKNELV